VNVARSPLNGRVDRRIHQADHRARIGRQFVDGQLLFARVVFTQQLKLEAFGGFFEHTGRTFALLQNRLNRRRRADGDFDWRGKQQRELVDHRQIGGVRHDDDEFLAFAVVRHEAVAQHQIRRDRAKQLVVDAELRQIDEFQTVTLGEAARDRGLRRVIHRGRLGAGHVQLGIASAGDLRIRVHQRSAFDRLNRGM
jgi:hypothetical protein